MYDDNANEMLERTTEKQFLLAETIYLGAPEAQQPQSENMVSENNSPEAFEDASFYLSWIS